MSYPCPSADCDKVFSKFFDLKTHRVTHSHPDNVFHCTECAFFTFTKKGLLVHVATHTGEKSYQCPDTITLDNTSSSSADELPCDFRTYDPSALTRHRKKDHGYVPPPNRSRSTLAASAALVDESAARRRRRPQRPAPVSRRKKTGVAPRAPNNCTLISADSLDQEDVDPDVMDVDYAAEPGYDFTGAVLIGTDDGVGLDVLYDPSLRSDWMGQYEQGYSSFDTTGMAYTADPEAFLGSSSFLDDFATLSGREGCLCPEWMVDAGIEGWDQNVLEAL